MRGEERRVRRGEEEGLGETGGGKEERQKKRRGQRVLSIHAHSKNPQIISLHCLKFESRRKCEMTIF